MEGLKMKQMIWLMAMMLNNKTKDALTSNNKMVSIITNKVQLKVNPTNKFIITMSVLGTTTTKIHQQQFNKIKQKKDLIKDHHFLLIQFNKSMKSLILENIFSI